MTLLACSAYWVLSILQGMSRSQSYGVWLHCAVRTQASSKLPETRLLIIRHVQLVCMKQAEVFPPSACKHSWLHSLPLYYC
jgi:hypothetical protein